MAVVTDRVAIVRRAGSAGRFRRAMAMATARVGDGAGRPLLGGDPGAALRALDAVRRPLYAEVAYETIDVDDLRPDEVAARIIEGVGVGP